MLHLALTLALAATTPYRLDNPAQVLVIKDGALLVADRGTHDRLLRVNPATVPGGALAVGDTGNNRILRIDPASGSTHTSGRLLRVMPDGSVSVVASRLRKPYALARARNGTVYVTQAGELSRPTGSLVRVLPDGRTSPIRLRAPDATRATAAARPTLIQPFDLQPLPSGRIVVTDMPTGAVYELDPVRKSGRLVARINQARELVLLKDGRVLVSSGPRVRALNLRTGRTTRYATAQNYLLGIALARTAGCTEARTSSAARRRRSSASAAARGRCWSSSTACTGSCPSPTV